MIHEPTPATTQTTSDGRVSHVTHVLLEAIVERSPLDTFDLWTRFEALPRLRRQGLVGDAAAVQQHTGALPRFAPSALTVVDGPDGYAGTVWIRHADGDPHVGGTTGVAHRASRSSIVLGVDDAAAAAVAARDLARFVEFVLVDGLDRELESVLPCACRGVVGPITHPSTAHVTSTSICGLPRFRGGHRDG